MLNIVNHDILEIRTQNAGPEFVEITDDMRRSASRISHIRHRQRPKPINGWPRRTDEVIEEAKRNLLNLVLTQLNAKVLRPDVRRVDLIDDFELDEFVNSFVDLLHPGRFAELT
jgi:hypothetical protein